jgi:hypothetical protein
MKKGIKIKSNNARPDPMCTEEAFDKTKFRSTIIARVRFEGLFF